MHISMGMGRTLPITIRIANSRQQGTEGKLVKAPGAQAQARAPLQAETPLSVPKLVRWAIAAISGLTGPFFLITGIAVLSTIVVQYNAQLIAEFIGQAQGGGGSSRGGGTGFIANLLPDSTEWTAILFALTGILAIGLAFANRVGTVWLNTRMLQRLQLRLHDKLLRMGPRYHGAHDMGENQALVMQYSAGAQPMLRDVVSFPFVRGISLLLAIVFLFYNLSALGGQDAVLYPILAVLLIVLPVGGFYLSGRLRTAFTAVREQQGALGNALVDSLTAPQEVQLLNANAQRSTAFSARLKELAKAQLGAVIQSETANQFQAAVPTLLQIGLILWAVFFVGGDAVQAVIGIYLFVPRVVQPIQEIIQFYAGINTAWPNIERIGTMLDMPVEIEDKGTRGASDLKNGTITLEDVTFRPDPERTVLDRVTHTFAPGKVTALVGRSGSGKTTILRLITRLFDPQGGRVTIGGIDVRDMRLAALRSSVATVSQFPLFVEADVRENLRLGTPEATDAQMEAACKAADLWPALQRLTPEDPLSTPVPRVAGKSGLAGGERRRLAIARALLADAPVLLLDEPSTGIDAMSINKIIREITGKAGRTVLLVDHDMDLVRAVSDQICCLEEGRFTDIGAPEELLGRPSLFKKLVDAKLAYASNAQYEIESLPVRPIEAGAQIAGAPKAGAPLGGAPKGGAPAGGPQAGSMAGAMKAGAAKAGSAGAMGAPRAGAPLAGRPPGETQG